MRGEAKRTYSVLGLKDETGKVINPATEDTQNIISGNAESTNGILFEILKYTKLIEMHLGNIAEDELTIDDV